VYVCDKAIRDEGTSYHYVSHGKYAHPDKKLTEQIATMLEKKKISFKKGTTWTIDAPYRETKSEVEQYKKEGVKTVEMEASALFVLGKVRKVKCAAIFVVSDVLGKKWKPNFNESHVRRKLNQVVEAVVG
jgi:uridine phosphorylase